MANKKINKKEENTSVIKKDTILVVGVIIIIAALIINYSNVPTGQVSKGQVYEKQLHYLMYAGNIESFGGHEIELISVTSLGDTLVSVDGNEPKIAGWSGCAANDVGTFIGNGRYNSLGKPCGVNVRVCSSSYDMQQADLDFVAGPAGC